MLGLYYAFGRCNHTSTWCSCHEVWITFPTNSTGTNFGRSINDPWFQTPKAVDITPRWQSAPIDKAWRWFDVFRRWRPVLLGIAQTVADCPHRMLRHVSDAERRRWKRRRFIHALRKE